MAGGTRGVHFLPFRPRHSQKLDLNPRASTATLMCVCWWESFKNFSTQSPWVQMMNCYTYNLRITAGCSSIAVAPNFLPVHPPSPAEPACCHIYWYNNLQYRVTQCPAHQSPLCPLPCQCCCKSADPFREKPQPALSCQVQLHLHLSPLQEQVSLLSFHPFLQTQRGEGLRWEVL